MGHGFVIVGKSALRRIEMKSGKKVVKAKAKPKRKAAKAKKAR